MPIPLAHEVVVGVSPMLFVLCPVLALDFLGDVPRDLLEGTDEIS